MTTVFGIKHPEADIAVLVADKQITTLNKESGITGGKYLSRKLWKSKNNDFCLGHIGSWDNECYEFVNSVSEGKYDIEKIIEKKNFKELRNLNIKRMGNKIPNLRDMSSFIIATRFEDNPKLYACFPLGSIEERIWTTFGSGEEKISEYMNALNVMGEARDYLKQDPVDSDDVIRVGLEALRRAQGQDLYSHGLDMIVCTKDKINDHYKELGDDFERKLKKIQNKYIHKK